MVPDCISELIYDFSLCGWIFMQENEVCMQYFCDIRNCSLQQQLSILIHQNDEPPDMAFMVSDKLQQFIPISFIVTVNLC